MYFKGTLWRGERGLPIILLAAVVQGWGLYGLHQSLVGQHWPATHTPLLLALYAVAIFIPLTLQFLAQHAHQRATWIILAGLTALVGYFGWHTGAMSGRAARDLLQTDEWVQLAFALVVLWLIALPFIQARLAEGRWRARYPFFFATAWTNKLALAEAFAFTGLFWLLLFLWKSLFNLLGIGFFDALFEAPLFVYPVTAIVFGVALHLIGSVERLTSIVLEQVLSVLKWLALVAGLILALFTIALVAKLPGMFASGQRVIGAAWLLWLVAVTVLLVNAAYRDGTVEQPYPRPIAIALRFVIPLVVIIALTAVIALYLRIQQYGFTVERVWGCIVAAAAVFYSIGYALAAKRSSPWMSSIAQVNIAVAVFMLIVIALTLTPVLSPHRIAANSQYALALAERPSDPGTYGTPLQYLRYNSGVYGTRKLEALAAMDDRPELQKDAAAILAQERWSSGPTVDLNVDALLEAMRVYPAESEIDQSLTAQIENDMRNPSIGWQYSTTRGPLIGVFIDLNDDAADEFVVLADQNAHAYERTADGWRRAGHFLSPSVPPESVIDILGAQGASTVAPRLRDFRIGPYVFHLSPGMP
jgi:hypothetical protein